MTEETLPRAASSPFEGAIRQVTRALAAAGAAYLVAHGLPVPPELVEAVALAVGGGVLAALAAAGKWLRDRGSWFGKLF